MGQTFKRKVGEALNIKVKLDDGAQTEFVRAYLSDKTGAPLTPAFVNLTHIANGVYSNNTFLMPNLDQVVVAAAVYTDNTFTTKKSYGEDMDIFEKDSFDPSNLIPPPARVEVMFTKPTVSVQIQKHVVEVAALKPPAKIEAEVIKGQIEVEFKDQQIEGGVNG